MIVGILSFQSFRLSRALQLKICGQEVKLICVNPAGSNVMNCCRKMNSVIAGQRETIYEQGCLLDNMQSGVI